jgi:hypothetical protein
MRQEFLGDSYDAVKRLWNDMLRPWAKLYAEPRFIPKQIQDDFTRLTGIEMLPHSASRRFAILNDPDTGVIISQQQRRCRKHISTAEIADQMRHSGVHCVITFDQSFKRQHDGDKAPAQRRAKLIAIAELGYSPFYYVSHATFLFVAQTHSSAKNLRQILINGGIPRSRLEKA